MNERIVKLAEQAGSTHKQNLGVYQFYEHELEKFADLIIRECVEILISGEGNDKTVDAIWDLGPAFDVDINQVLDQIES